MHIFECHGNTGQHATITVQSLHPTQLGSVKFSANDDNFAIILLTQCRSDSAGFFNLLAGTKPLYIEQWLDYLKEQNAISHYRQEIVAFEPEQYGEKLCLEDEQAEHLLALLYQVGGFNKLQVSRFIKQRKNLASMATRYSKEDLARYLKLGEAINYILQLKSHKSK
ncbi:MULTISPECIES: hypothetical protein [unclassified Motilimonas]|uniref:hypothetical protein n=1 Tax=Motilimonas TaxID=1914248 RepID=UPI001E655B5B|nr:MULTISPECIES: hypothetical protein [unclassified Motilimonas]MCE0559049.1 hypothetical protein [Motilimonas sp. E26]MDO6526993.1 hypothetical protein [Motilimonas sp. 1_MG-2023]